MTRCKSWRCSEVVWDPFGVRSGSVGALQPETIMSGRIGLGVGQNSGPDCLNPGRTQAWHLAARMRVAVGRTIGA